MMNIRMDRAVLLLVIVSICIYGFLIFIDVIDYSEAEAIEISDPVDITIEANDYDELVVVVQELQKMVGKLIDAGNVQINCLESLTNIDSSLLERIEKLENVPIVPTWPDYIELEKDLVLRYDFPKHNDPLLIEIPTEYRIFSKGTKIYFKGDE